jgi:hypothetical protein
MKKTFGVRLAAFLIALLVSTNAFAAYNRDGEFDPIQRIIKKIERIWRGLGDTLTLPKP